MSAGVHRARLRAGRSDSSFLARANAHPPVCASAALPSPCDSAPGHVGRPSQADALCRLLSRCRSVFYMHRQRSGTCQGDTLKMQASKYRGNRFALKRWVSCAIAASAISASSAAAAETVCGSYYCSDVNIKQFNVMSDGTVYIEFDGPKSNLSCSLYGGTSVTLLPSTNDRLYSFLLTSYFQKRSTMIRITEGSSGCTILYAA